MSGAFFVEGTLGVYRLDDLKCDIGGSYIHPDTIFVPLPCSGPIVGFWVEVLPGRKWDDDNIPEFRVRGLCATHLHEAYKMKQAQEDRMVAEEMKDYRDNGGWGDELIARHFGKSIAEVKEIISKVE